MSAPLEGPDLLLRPLRRGEESARYLLWLADPEVNRYLEVRHHPQTPATLADFIGAHEDNPDAQLFAIRLRADGRHIGNLRLAPIDRRYRTATLGLLIGERDCWGKGFATQAIGLACEHAFGTLGLRRLAAGAYAANQGSIRAFERNGFEREGLLRGAALLDGAPEDVVLLGRLA